MAKQPLSCSFWKASNLDTALLTNAGMVRRREIGRYFLRHFSCGRPLRATLQGHDEADVRHRFRAVPEYRVEHTAVPVIDHHEYRFMFTGPSCFRIGESSGQDVHVRGGGAPRIL